MTVFDETGSNILLAVMTDSDWKADFYTSNALFKDIIELAQNFNSYKNWPDLAAYNDFLNKRIPIVTSQQGKNLQFVQQGDKPESVSEQYEVRIYQDGEIQTREKSWHDFFQVLIWCQFPLTKRSINQRHAEAILNRCSTTPVFERRTPIENCLTLFDECGMIIVSSDPELLKLIQTFKWQQLFIDHRGSFNKSIDAYIFGHAMYEKALQPYIGMTANSICLSVDEDFFTKDRPTQIQIIDQLASDYFLQQTALSPNDLQPFPLLGIPGWDKRNEQQGFYDNTEYFRRGRTRKS
jgi:hypothetical protein